MKVQTREYIEFIRSFTEASNIMTKSFFIVIPYTPSALADNDVVGKLLGKNAKDRTADKTQNFEENKSQLEQRVNIVEQGLVRCGIRVAALGTEEIVELYYKIFNPGETEKPIQVN